ncbi:hypothetical protein BGT96224_5527 [Blumeria graminis f. sp. tritici 96224]|uniref:Uncharacterized protein n=1 Tax=Blumeria graminis f. sp. tritici 96224 TaxID=1268274 RepID=A0A656KHJ6_BLUGR|nr:hypothetical protein BGT96224_5527 [Blumeria graminis f. sp. tritici 96224]
MDADIPPPPYSQTDLNPRKSPCSKSSEIVAPRGYFNTPYLLQTPVVSTIDLIDHQPCFEGSFLILEPTHLCFSLQEPLYPGAAPCQIYQLQRSPLSRPQDFPHFPQFSLRDITEQDWTAFLNILVYPRDSLTFNQELRPANTTNPSSNLNSGQCLKAERVVKEMYGLSLSDSGLSGIWIGSDSALIAALNQASHHSEITSSLSYFATEWNKKFFAPRGMKIIFNKRNDIPLHLEKKISLKDHWSPRKVFFRMAMDSKLGQS